MASFQLTTPRLILASQSPRRRDLLFNEGLQFEVSPLEISEKLNKNLSLTAAVEDIARQKADAWRRSHKELESQSILCLTADTLVFFEGQAMGKPKSLDEAREFIRRLSGETHSVITGYCLLDLSSGEVFCDSDETLIQFKHIEDDEIENYLINEDVCDKAGAYGIQGEAKKFVNQISGSLSNVIGLPLEKLLPQLKARGIRRNS